MTQNSAIYDFRHFLFALLNVLIFDFFPKKVKPFVNGIVYI